MKRMTLEGIPVKLALGLVALAAVAAPSFAVELAAVPAQWTPPGGGTPIAMWGFIEVTDAATFDCATVSPSDPWAVGPTLTATAASSLTVNLKNCLSTPVSAFIPGQLKATVPVMFLDGVGRSRVRSFDAETAPGLVGSYTWTGVKEGTYLYHSGTHPQVQVQMGLYGALTVGNYGYANEATLVYSEIDPALHAAVAGGTYGTPAYPSTFDYKPRYFLINGAAYPDGADIFVDTITDVLLRFVNAGLKTHVPTLEGGLYMSLIAEDGNLYPFPMEQYGIELQAAKTIDAVVNVGTNGTYALYDRSLLGLTNWLETGGGMLTYIQAGAAVGAPLAVDDAYATAEDTPLSELAATGVLANDLDAGGTLPIPATYQASLVSGVSGGALTLNPDGSFLYTPDPFFNGTDLFSYQAVDTAAGPNSNVATVTITVAAVNNPPVANDDSATTPPDTTVTIGVVANDTDVDGNLDPTTANTACVTGTPVCSGPANGTLVNNGDGTFDYTPSLAFIGTDSFVYEVCDTEPLCDTATVTITVVNNPPVANDDAAVTPANTDVIVDVVANDTDVDGNLDPTSVTVTVPATSGLAVSNGDGTVTYTPNLDYLGSDSFVYEVCDTGALCDTATVTITVVNDTPVANDDFTSTVRNTPVTFSVIVNDTDADGIDPATVVITTGPLTQRGGTVVANPDGTVTYEPKRGFRGTDLFQYTVNDNLGATSNVATVTVNVTRN